MKMKKSNRVLLIIVSVLILYLLLCIGRFFMNKNRIPCLQNYRLDFSSNSGEEAREKMGMPISVLEATEESRLYYTYRKPVLGKDAEIELVVNELTDYFFQVNVTWEFDDKQEAADWFTKVKREVRKNGFIPFVLEEEKGDSTDWECDLCGVFCDVEIYGTSVIYSAIDNLSENEILDLC